MAKQAKPASAGTDLVRVELIDVHDLPGQRLRPGIRKVSSELRDELRALGKIKE